MHRNTGGLPPGGNPFYEQVFEQHYRALYRFVLRLGLSEADSHDVAQEVYLRIVRQNEPDRLRATPRAYL